MAEAAHAQTTLRDTLAEQFDALEGDSGNQAVTQATQESPNLQGSVSENETASQAQRARDEAGRFAKKQEEPPLSAAEPAKARPPRPSSWKKDYEAQWETLDPSLAEYIHQRESEYAKGVSTYRDEALRAKDLQDAMAPFMADLQQHNIAPAQWISNLGNAHKTLAMGSPQQKAQMFAKLAQDYGIDLGMFTGQQQDPRIAQMAQELNDLRAQVGNTTKAWQQREQNEILAHINQFASNKEAHPHYEQVKDVMAQLLESGIAPDLETAYAKAVRLSDDAWQAEQARQQQAQEAKLKEAAAAARSRAVSPKTATPSGAVTTGAKDRRSQIAELVEAAGTGRV
jgi:hypothetical protein